MYFSRSADFRVTYFQAASRYLRVVGLSLVLLIAADLPKKGRRP